MGLLDQVIGGVLGQVLGEPGRGEGRDPGGPAGGMSPIVRALLMLLLRQGAGGPAREADPPREGDYGDLAGMLDGPGGASSARDPGAGPYAGLDREPGDAGEAGGRGGFDELVDRFRHGGLGDVVESWIGPGANRPVQPGQLGAALGPDLVEGLSRRTGLDRGDLLAQLSRVLPEVIDRLTPDGRRPSEAERRAW